MNSSPPVRSAGGELFYVHDYPFTDRKANMPTISPPFLAFWRSYESSPDSLRLTPSSRRSRRRSWYHFSAWMRDLHPEIRDLRSVTRLVCEEYVGSFRCGHSAATSNFRLYDLRNVFRTLLSDLGIAANPWNCVRPSSADTRARRELSADEVRRLLASAAEEGAEWRTLFAIGAYTGLRLGDCCRLAWEQVDMDRAIIQLVPRKTRRFSGGRLLTIPIHAQLMSALAETPPASRSGAVLAGIQSDFHSRRWIVSRSLGRIFASAGIVTSVAMEGRSHRTPVATFHSLRHSFVSFAANAGVPLAVVQSIVGHSSSAMTRHYYHASETALRAAVNSIPSFTASDGRAASPLAAAPATSRLSLCYRLRRIQSLLEKGLVTAEEHAAMRQRILSEA